MFPGLSERQTMSYGFRRYPAHYPTAKYGLGVLVDAERNTQLMCYGIAALGVYESLYDIKEVSLSIFQPRRENVQTWTVSVDELKDWAENELKPKAQMAAKGEGEYCPGEWLYWSSFLVTLCSEIMLYIETPLVSYSYSLNEVSHSCTS